MSVISETGLSLSPYPGLRPFRRDEADIFFGREEQVDQLLAKLEVCRFLAVVGVSGCGKSSLVRAGMLSAQEGGFMASAGPRWHVMEMRPGGHPLANLAQAVLRGELLGQAWRNRPDADAFVCAVLRRGPLALVELMREALQPRQQNLLLLVDQFEEIFRFHQHGDPGLSRTQGFRKSTGSDGDAGEATAFVDLLLESARQNEMPIYVVLTMRSDFLGDCSIFAGLPEAINDGQFLIPRLTREQCRAAVIGPAAAFGASVQPELVNHVLNDIGSNPDQLPLMQHALMRVWTGAVETALRDDKDASAHDEVTLSLADYEAVGGLKNALSNHADELFARLSPDDQRIAESLFRSLSERGADGRDIRRPVPLQAAADVAQVSAETIIRIVNVFREPTCSFLTPPAGMPLLSDTVLDISHESLIRQWHRMSGWVQAEADSASIFRRLAETAVLWEEGRAALWDTPDLENALAWREREQSNPVWAERYGGRFAQSMAFLNASVEAHARRERAEKERQERERDLLQNMARAEKQRADDAEARRKEQATANALLKRRAIAAVGASVVAIVLAVAAFILYAQAKDEQQRADQARQDAETAKQRADALAGQEADARKRSQQAELAALSATNTAHANLGQANLAQLKSLWNSNEPGRQVKALRLLRESATLRDTSLQFARRQAAAPRQFTEQFWRQLTPQLREQAVRWLSLTSLQQIRGIPFTLPSNSSRFPQFSLSPDGKRLAVFKPDTRNAGELQILDALTGNVAASVKTAAEQRYPVALGFSTDGRTLKVAFGGTNVPQIESRSAADLAVKGTVRLATSGNSPPLSYYYGDRDDHWFDSDGKHFVYSGSAGIFLWNAETGKRLYAGGNTERAARATRITNTFAVVRNRNSTAFINLKDGKTVRSFPLQEGNSTITGATLSPDGDWLALELNYRYTNSGQYELPLLIVNTATGETVSRVNMTMPSNYYSSSRSLDVAFHPRRPVLSVVDSQHVSLISVPQGGILYQARAAETPDAGRRRFTADQIAFTRSGDLLLTALRDTNYYPSSSGTNRLVMLQLWDPSVASASLQTLALQGTVQDFTFAGEEALAVAGGDSDRTGVQIRPLKGVQPWMTTSASPSGGFEPSGKHYVHVLPNQADILDARTGKRLMSLDRRWPGYAAALPVSNGYRWIVGVDRGGNAAKLRLFDAGRLQWTTVLLDAGSTLTSVLFSDEGDYVAVSGNQAAPSPSTSSQPRSVVYDTSRGAKVFETPKTLSEWRVLKSGYLLTREYESNEYVVRAHELKSGRQTSEFRVPSSGYTLSLRYRFWLDGDEKTAAYLDRSSGSAGRVHVWPFAAGKSAAPLDATFLDYYNTTARIVGDRLLISGNITPRLVKGKASPNRYEAQLWDLSTQKKLKSWPGRTAVAYLASVPHGKVMIFSASRSTNSKTGLWDLKTAEQLAAINGYPRGLSPDGRFAVFPTGEVLDLSTNKVRPSPTGSLIASYEFSADSRFLATVSRRDEDATVGILNLRDSNSPWKLDTSLQSVYQAVLSPDSRLLMTYSYKTPHAVHLWNLGTGTRIATKSIRRGNFRPDVDTVTRLTTFQFSPGSRHYAVVSHDQLRLGNTDDPQVHTELPRSGHRLVVHAVDVSPDKRFVASGSADQTVCFWRAKNGRYLGMLEDGGNSSIRNVAFSPRGNLIATRKENGEIVVWKWSRPADPEGEVTATYLWSNARGDGQPLAFSPDGTQLAAGDADGGIRLFNARSGLLVSWLQPRGATGGVRGLAFGPAGKVLTAARGHVIGLWDVTSGSLRRAWDAGQGPIFDLAFPADGRFLISTGSDVRLWDPDTAAVQLTLDNHSSAVRHAAVSDSGERLAFAVDDRSIVITNVTGLLKSVEELGLKLPAGASVATAAAWKQPLWTPATAKDVLAENTLSEFLPKAYQAERDKDWKQAVVYLSKLIAIDPNNAGYRRRRFDAYLKLIQWAAAAEDASRLLDAMPHDEYRTSQRSVWLRDVLRRQPELFAALEAKRPKDPLLPIVRGRDFALQNKWHEAKKAYGKLIRSALAHENWYEYAALCLLAGDRKAYDLHVAWMAGRKGEPNGHFNAYVYARTAAVAADSRLPQTTYLAWVEAAIGKQRNAYYLHAAALAYYRAGKLDLARRTLQESMKTRWVPSLNQLALGLVEYHSGNYEDAKSLLERAQDWRKAVEASKTDGLVNVLVPDWVEANILLPELEALIAKGPLPAGKPVEAVKPKTK